MVLFGTILAADKLLIDGKSAYLVELGERPILGILLRQMEKCKIREWSVVFGNDHDFHRRAVESFAKTYVVDDYWEKGFESHALIGLNEMPPQAEGFIILPGNLPFFSSEIANKMFEALLDEKGFIIAAESDGEILPYPLFHRRFLGEVINRLENKTFFDALNDHPDDTYLVELPDKSFIHQVTDPESLNIAREIYYRIDPGTEKSNPQSTIPE